jgi:quercetin dioxygenase-like cupin family protein
MSSAQVLAVFHGFCPGSTFAHRYHYQVKRNLLSMAFDHVKYFRRDNFISCHKHLDLVFLFALQALPSREMAAAEAQISSCEDCRKEIETLRPVVRSFVGWSTDVVRPAESLWSLLAERIASEGTTQPFVPPLESPVKPEWEEAAPGIHVKILARNTENDSVSMLVRLDPGTDYPGHTHAGVEELHLLHGILKVDDRTLYPGDFIHSEAGSVDHRVWSETGCTCFLVTSTEDALF